jgi:Cu(I)/Ag(I) efflux system membrane fusion protein
MNRSILVWLASGALVACSAKPAPAPHEHNGMAPSGTPTDGPMAEHEHGSGAMENPLHLMGYAPVVVDPGRQQLLGIKTAPVTRQRIDKPIRTVGVVQMDETRTTHVHVKYDGFIEQIYVNYTGRLVHKGQPLFKIFSRDLLAAEQEYLASRTAAARVAPGASDAVRKAAQQLANAARERLRLFDVPPSVLADIERTGVAQRSITVISPQTGNVIAKEAIEGLAVTPMMHLYIIADLSRVWLVADFYERDMAQLHVGQQATMRIDALPGRTFSGTVTFVSPTVDPSTRTIKVRFEFPNQDGALRPGMYATVELAAMGGEGLVVPADSVIDTGERKVVFVAHGDGKFEPRAIVTGVALEGQYQVLAGLRDGEVIATSGQFLLDSESRIRGARTGGGPAHGGH